MIKSLMLGMLLLGAACSGSNDDGDSGGAGSEAQKCDAHTDLTQGTIDGPECDEAHDVFGSYDTPAYRICTDYLFESSVATAGEICDTSSQLGFCVDHDPRFPDEITLMHMYEDPDSSLDDCGELHLSSYQCLNNPLNTWCNVKYR